MSVTIKQLKVFTVLAKVSNMQKAAEQLFLTKPAVSLSLAELEKHIGHKLFARINNRLVLNEEGRMLMPLADEMLQRLSFIEQSFSENGQLKSSLSIGASDTIGNHIVPSLVNAYRENVTVVVNQLFISNTAAIIEKLIDFDLDIGLIEGQSHHPKFEHIPWLQDEMVLVASTDHPLAQHNRISYKMLKNSVWLLREEGSGSREYFMNHIAAKLDYWHEDLQLNTTESIINFCAQGVGLACLSLHAARHAINDKRLVILPFQEKLQRQYWLLVHKEKYQSPSLKQFISFCLEQRTMTPMN